MTGARQWIQPLFMVYDTGSDELVPLTQERLNSLIDCERTYGMMISEIKKSHFALVERHGNKPQPWK